MSEVLGILINLKSSGIYVAKQERPRKAEISPGLCLPRFAKYYRDEGGVEFRTLIKAYGIRFDVLVNGRVRELHLPLGGWAGMLGGPLLSTCSLTLPCLSLCFRQGSSTSSPQSSTWAQG